MRITESLNVTLNFIVLVRLWIGATAAIPLMKYAQHANGHLFRLSSAYGPGCIVIGELMVKSEDENN